MWFETKVQNGLGDCIVRFKVALVVIWREGREEEHHENFLGVILLLVSQCHGIGRN